MDGTIRSKQFRKIDCKICYDTIERETDALELRVCNHEYHKECAKRYLESEISQSKCPIVCPEPSCKKEIAIRDMIKTASAEDMDKFYNYSF